MADHSTGESAGAGYVGERDEQSAALIAESDAWDRAGERADEIADYVMGLWWAGQPYQTSTGREIGMEERRDQVRVVAHKVLLGQMPDGLHMRFVPGAKASPTDHPTPEETKGQG